MIALRFNTTGFEAQPRVMQLLKRKFGSPGSQKAVTWNSDLGGSRGGLFFGCANAGYASTRAVGRDRAPQHRQ